MVAEHRVYFGKLDSMAAYFDLMVYAAQELDVAAVAEAR